MNKIIKILALVFVFAFGFGLTLLISGKPMSEEELNQCEQIAYESCYPNDKTISEVPENFYIKKTETTITVGKNGYRDFAVARVHNGEVITVRKTNIGAIIGSGVIIGFVSVAFALIGVWASEEIKREKENKGGR